MSRENEYTEESKERQLEACKKWYWSHKEFKNEKCKEWYLKNTDITGNIYKLVVEVNAKHIVDLYGDI